jgi:sortase (surface protein transpeptidase)
MFRIIAAGYIALLFIIFLFVFVRAEHSAPQDTMIASSKTVMATLTPTETPAPTATATPTPPQAAAPVRLIVPRLHLDTAIEAKGNDSAGHMDVPADWNHVAWYNLGPKPGEAGGAVIAGHYDTGTGAPASFFYLSALQPGDVMYVVDEANRVLTFKVADKRNYEYDLFPVEEVFNDLSGRKLNLITCSGIWDHALHNYTNRLVVFTELQ